MQDPRYPLKGQVALVTGATSGIGAGVALAFGKAGAKVAVNHPHSPESADGIVSQIFAEGGDAIAVAADVSKEPEVLKMYDDVFKCYGTVDILVANAGVQRDAALVDMTFADWQFVLGINLTGQFLCAREAAKEFIRRGVVQSKSVAAGKILFMSSVHEVIPWAGHCNYAASKGGLMLLMKSIAQELAPRKIRVNEIGSGAIKTPINHAAWETPEAEESLLKLIPYHRVGIPEDVAKAAVWLASDASDYVNGITLFVDGGMTLYPVFLLVADGTQVMMVAPPNFSTPLLEFWRECLMEAVELGN